MSAISKAFLTENISFVAGTVHRIEERFETVWVSGVGKDSVTRQKSLGWFVVLDTGAAFGFGHFSSTGNSIQPDCAVGDEVFLEFRRSARAG